LTIHTYHFYSGNWTKRKNPLGLLPVSSHSKNAEPGDNGRWFGRCSDNCKRNGFEYRNHAWRCCRCLIWASLFLWLKDGWVEAYFYQRHFYLLYVYICSRRNLMNLFYKYSVSLFLKRKERQKSKESSYVNKHINRDYFSMLQCITSFPLLKTIQCSE